MECMTLRTEQVFVRDLPVEEIYRTVMRKLDQGAALTEQELMQLIILPLAEPGTEKKQRRIEQVIRLTDRIEDEREQKLVLSGLLVISDKFISTEDAETIRRRIGMTKIGRMLFEDGMKEGEREGMKKTAGKLLKKGIAVEIIMEVTDLTEEEIREIEKNMLVSQ